MIKDCHQVGDWCLGRVLGSGTTGKVKLAENVRTSEQTAMKIIKKSQFSVRPDLERKIRREVALMKLMEHPHLLKLIDCSESPHHIYLVLEFCAGGELFDYLVSKRRLPRCEAMGFFREIIYGIEYLHQHGICHRDLKPENLLLDATNHIKIADFGFARWMKSNVADTSCGSPHYAAPEVIRGHQYDGRMADVWSAGVILFALLAGTLPFDDPSIRVVLSKVKSGKFTMPALFDSDVAHLISRILQVDVQSRITIEGIKSHPAFLVDLPEGYFVPSPIPLVEWADPIDLNAAESFLGLLISIGYDSMEEVCRELAAREHTPAKTFYRIWSRPTAVDALPWPSGGSRLLLDWDCTMLPHDFPQSGTTAEPFGRRNECILEEMQSPHNAKSLAVCADWIPACQSSEAFAAPVRFTEIRRSLPRLMLAVQRFLDREGFEFFHPDDRQYIARRLGGEAEFIVRIQAGFVKEELMLDVSGMIGSVFDLEEFAERIRAMLMELQHY
jgi:serine/threonine protein kinase